MAQRSRRKRFPLSAVLDMFEPRQLMSAAHFSSAVYVETNNPAPGQNAVIAYGRNSGGSLTEIGSFNTGGTGFANTTGLLGPDDSDKEVIASPDGKFLFAVNQGSNSVAAFRIRNDGSLSLVHDAPFGSGGTQPVSLTIDNGRLYVVNRSDEIQGQTGTVPPTISVFNIDKNGALDPLKNATVTLPQGLSPSQILPSRNGNLLFADTFTPPPLLNVADADAILPFTVGKDGQLTAGAALPAAATPPLILGLSQHPTQNIIYAGLTAVSEIGVFTYNSTGALTLAGTVPVQGAAPCWTLISPDAKTLYTIDTGTDSVGVFSITNPLHPTQIQEFSLGGPQNIANNPAAPSQTTDFEFALDPSGKSLYVIDHETTTGFAQGNALHTLSVAANGTLSEIPGSPTFLPASIAALGARPQGVATVALAGHDDDHGDHHDANPNHGQSSDIAQTPDARAGVTGSIVLSGNIHLQDSAPISPNFTPAPTAHLQPAHLKPVVVTLDDASL